MSKDYYNILGITENASKDDIKKAFRSLAKQHHPDKNKGDKASEDKFKEISEAYDVLGDEEKRRQYDTMRKYGAFAGAGQGGGYSGGGFGGFGGRQGGSFSFEDIGGFGSFSDIFSAIFGNEDLFGRSGRGGFAGTGRRRRKGQDIGLGLKISFLQSAQGTTKTIILNKPEKCTSCGATGEQPGSSPSVCPQCGGRGTMSFAQGAFSVSRPCTRCLGRGSVPGRLCTVCNGSGSRLEKRKIKIKIPAGIDNGGKIRLRGMGYPGKDGGPEGDLIITVNVKKDQQFDRDGKDIRTKIEIPYTTAVLGGKTTIRTLTSKIKLTIPSGTKPGTVMRLKGLGLSVNGTQGDQFVEINIAVPTDLTDRQKELLEELAKTFE